MSNLHIQFYLTLLCWGFHCSTKEMWLTMHITFSVSYLGTNAKKKKKQLAMAECGNEVMEILLKSSPRRPSRALKNEPFLPKPVVVATQGFCTT